MSLVYLSLGSNLGDRRAALKSAVTRLDASGVNVMRLSAIYETEPQDVPAQPWFLNQVVECQTFLEPEPLLQILLAIEHSGGRAREGVPPRGPRIIDLDILLYGDLVVEASQLVIPHPRMIERRFVLQPLLELNAGLIHPKTKQPLKGYLAKLAGQELRTIS